MDQIRINVNGVQKLASGLTKETTVQDIKFAMLHSSVSSFNPQTLNEYGLFEQWQSNERLLEPNVKFYKIIKMWKQVPGEQLSQVKFLIKKKHSKSYIKHSELNREFKLCSLSPSAQKSWNRNKSSYVKKQMQKLDQQDAISVNSIPSSAWSSSNEDSDDECFERKRYASVRRTYKSRSSSVKRMVGNSEKEKKTKMEELNQLKNELNQIKLDLVKIKQTNSSLETMKNRLKQIDNLILIKSSLISSLEKELQRLSSINQAKCPLSSSNSASSISSTDTGISSAHSDGDETCFQTLV